MVNEGKQQEVLLPFGVHKVGDESFELMIYEESNGTQSAYSLLGLILPVLKNGGVAIIDELDNDLHPLLLPAIFDLFRSLHHNPHNAQLIFSCHTPEVFNLLNKHQIYLVEKYDCTHIFIGLRKDTDYKSLKTIFRRIADKQKEKPSLF